MSNKYRDSKRHRGMTVEVRNDDFGRALRTFSKKVQDSGLLQIVKEKMSYEKPAVLRQRLKKQARKRWERAVEEMITNGHWHKDKKY
ncbi:MAG: 30S ribosomal protein S21 [Lentisphaerota bacterium]